VSPFVLNDASIALLRGFLRCRAEKVSGSRNPCSVIPFPPGPGARPQVRPRWSPHARRPGWDQFTAGLSRPASHSRHALRRRRANPARAARPHQHLPG